jgi:DNA repair photolyase
MALNEAKGNMYDFVTHTWNTVKGKCPHGCSYCYMKRFGEQKPVRFDEKELKTDLGSGNFIFVGSSCDMFAIDIPVSWINRTLIHCRDHNNKYLFQSKSPYRMLKEIIGLELKEKSILCTTIETNRVYPMIMCDCPTPETRARDMALADAYKFKTFVTIEPVMDFDTDELLRLIRMCNPTQVNIGADSGNNHLPEPSAEKLLDLIAELQKFTVIAKKRNLERLLRKQ